MKDLVDNLKWWLNSFPSREGKCEDKMATPILSSEGCVPVGTRLKSYKKSPCQKAEA